MRQILHPHRVPSQQERVFKLLLVTAAWFIFSLPFAAAGTNKVTEPFEGVRLIHSKSTVPRLIAMWVVEIDMSAPGVGFVVTPSNGGLIGDTTPQTVRTFVTQVGAQIGVNGSFFAMAAKGAASKGQYDVLGLSVSKGDAYSPFERGFVDAINISQNNVATIIRGTGKGNKAPHPVRHGATAPVSLGMAHNPAISLYNALSGKTRLVKDGKNVAGKDPAIHPRTAVGITADGKLLLFTVDGREPGHSLGLKFNEMADILIRWGARDAISLDGGGSTTLVMDDPTTSANDPQVMNMPCDLFPNKQHGKERAVGNSLAVFARKRSEPARNTLVGHKAGAGAEAASQNTEVNSCSCGQQSASCCRSTRRSVLRSRSRLKCSAGASGSVTSSGAVELSRR